MKSATLKVNPAVLVWAREERGFDNTAIAKKLGKDISLIKEWENTGDNIPFSDLKKIAKAYRRQISVFFLAEVPPKTKIPKDRRNLKVNEDGLSPETLLAVRRTSRYLKIARELSDKDEVKTQYDWLGELVKSGSLVEAASKLREIFDVSIQDQQRCTDSAAALRMWRQKIETNLSIYTFQFPMPENEIDGFSYVEEGVPYAITLSSRNTKNRQIFTLFHELGHILEGSSGICLTSNVSVSNNIEARCNIFAADFLMPEEAMKVPNTYEDLKTFAQELCVSTEAYARRAYALNSISKPTLDVLLEQIGGKKQKPKRESEMRISPLVMSKSRRGEKFFNLIVDAYTSGRISGSAAADILMIRPTKIDGS